MLEWFDLVQVVDACVSLMTTMVLSFSADFAFPRFSLASRLLLLAFDRDVSHRGSSLVVSIGVLKGLLCLAIHSSL